MAASWDDFFEDSLSALKRQGRYRSLRVVDALEPPWVEVNGARLLQFASNDYLGLAQDQRLRRAAERAAREIGLGSGASRLVTGNNSEVSRLEAEVAAFKHTEAALIFPTGYSANVGVISALAGKNDRIISDRLNHASIVDGCRLSGAQIDIYPHGDVTALRRLLAGTRVSGRTLVVTDGVFSMDGDVAPIPEIHALCRDYGALLLIDDAHGTGVLGETGRGSLEYRGVRDASIVQIGTFSKALGSLGGFVAARRVVIDYLINKARTQIYSTGMPAPVAAGAREGLAIVSGQPELRLKLAALVRRLRNGIRTLGFSVGDDPTPIIPLVIGGDEQAVRFSEELLRAGVLAPAIRPPSVPPEQSRIRLSLTAAHDQEHVDTLLNTLETIVRGAQERPWLMTASS